MDDRTPPSPEDLTLTPQAFNARFKGTPVKRAKRRGYLRNLAVALGNTGDAYHLPMLQQSINDPEPIVREHAEWAMDKINRSTNS